MKWALKFSTKGKGAGGGPDAGKSYRDGSNGGGGGLAAGGEGAFRSGSDGEEAGGEYYEDEGLDPGQERDTPIVTPPDAVNGGGGRGAAGAGGPDRQHRERGGEKYEQGPGDENSSATYEGEDEHNNGSSAPHFTVDSAGRPQRGGLGGEEGEEMDYEDERQQQQGVFDEDGEDSQADSLQASKTARMKSFADDPEAHALGDNAEWDGESLA